MDHLKILKTLETSLFHLIFRNNDCPLCARDTLKTLLDVGLLHHFFCVRISIAPIDKNQSEWLDDYFKQLYTSRFSLNAELSGLLNSTSVQLDLLSALRLLNLATFTSTVSTETPIRILSLFPELLTQYSISLFASELDSLTISRFLAPFTSLGNPDVNSIFTLVNLEANDSATRCKELEDINLHSSNPKYENLYHSYRALLIAKGRRSTECIKTTFYELVKLAPGLHRPYSILVGFRSDQDYPTVTSAYETYNYVAVGQYRGFLLPFAETLIDLAYVKKSFPLTTVYLIREISEFCEIVPYAIRSRLKRAAAYLFLKAGQFREWRKACEPIFVEAIEKSNSFERLDPFALELFVEDTIEYLVQSQSTIPSQSDGLRYIWLCGPSPKANIASAKKFALLLKSQGYDVSVAGYTDILHSAAFTLATTLDIDIFATTQYWSDYSTEISNYIEQQINCLPSAASNSTQKVYIICEENSLYWLSWAPYLVRQSAILYLEPPTEEALYCSLHQLFGYSVPQHVTPSLADTIFHERLRKLLIANLKRTYPQNVYEYHTNDHCSLSIIFVIQFLTEAGFIKLYTDEMASTVSQTFHSTSSALQSDHTISNHLQSNQDYKDWLQANSDDLNLLSAVWTAL